MQDVVLSAAVTLVSLQASGSNDKATYSIHAIKLSLRCYNIICKHRCNNLNHREYGGDGGTLGRVYFLESGKGHRPPPPHLKISEVAGARDASLLKQVFAPP